MNKKNSGISPYMLMALIFFQGASGIFGGGALILEPNGGLIQMPVTMLEGTPFNTFLVPGIILFVVLGFFPMFVLYGLWKRDKWAWTGALLLSVALIIWISVEIALVGYHTDPPLQLVYGLVGMALLMLSLMPSVKNWFNNTLVNAKKKLPWAN